MASPIGTQYHLHIGLPVGFDFLKPSVAHWLFFLGYRIGRVHPEITHVTLSEAGNWRVDTCRNVCVADARRAQATQLLFLDPDMALDYYAFRGDPGAKFWWPEAWEFIREQPEPCVAAVPYCGGRNQELVHVFRPGLPEEGRETVRLLPDEAARLTGWQRVGAVGTGCMLIDMRVFDILDRWEKAPFFKDQYDEDSDWRHTAITQSQDLYFCQRCRRAEIPIWVNFSCWSAHHQPHLAHRPPDPTLADGSHRETSPPALLIPQTGQEPSAGCARSPSSGLRPEAVCYSKQADVRGSVALAGRGLPPSGGGDPGDGGLGCQVDTVGLERAAPALSQ